MENRRRGSPRLGVDYHEVFAPTAFLDLVRVLLSIVAYHSWPLYQL